jgi:hypothetical protein
LLVNVLVFKIKAILRSHRYEVTYLYGHLFDLILIIRFSITSKRYVNLLWVLLLWILIVGFFYNTVRIFHAE